MDEKETKFGSDPAQSKGKATQDAGALDLEIERIDTEGVLKEGFAGQEM